MGELFHVGFRFVLIWLSWFMSSIPSIKLRVYFDWKSKHVNPSLSLLEIKFITALVLSLFKINQSCKLNYPYYSNVTLSHFHFKKLKVYYMRALVLYNWYSVFLTIELRKRKLVWPSDLPAFIVIANPFKSQMRENCWLE